MVKKLDCGYTLEEIEDMGETVGIEPSQLHHALTYMQLKRQLLKDISKRTKGSDV